MHPTFEDELPVLLHGLSAFLPSEQEARSFFSPIEKDLWEMAEALGNMGCPFVVIKCGSKGQLLWDGLSKRRWHIPAYPARVKDVTGAGDSFCGGFLVGLDTSDDPLEASLRGAVSASITIEGLGPLYALDAYPGLAEARLKSLRSAVREA
jgi:sugar/nucleoside kinase (ribokinase family)